MAKRISFCTFYNFLRLILRFSLNIFFKNIQIVGESNIPQVPSITNFS